jgi:hypothetical protein
MASAIDATHVSVEVTLCTTSTTGGSATDVVINSKSRK